MKRAPRLNPFLLQLDDGMILPGVELAIKSMEKGEDSEFLINKEHAYGDMGCPPRVLK